MKKISTLTFALCMVIMAFAQHNFPKSVISSEVKSKLTSKNFTRTSSAVNNDRAANVSFAIDYDAADEAYANSIGATYQRFVWDINRRYTNADNFTMRWAASIFDSIIAVDYDAGTIGFYPRSSTTMTLDSLQIYHNHQNNTGGSDTLKVTVFDTDVFTVTGNGPAAVLNTTSIWDTTIITTTSLSPNDQNVFALTLVPNLTLAQGQSIGVRVDFTGDTANKFQILSGYRDECADACAAEPTTSGFNSLWYFNYTTQTGTNISGINSLGLDCDMDGTVGTPGSCEEFYLQNHAIVPFMSAVVDYGTTILASTAEGCPGASVELSAPVFGTSAPSTFNWSVSPATHTLSSTSDSTITLTLGPTGDATVIVIANDGSGNVSDTLVIRNRGININFSNSNPATLNCGSNLNLATQISGFTQGRVYTWSTGATGANVTTQSVNVGGNYSVTVTNNAGCSATATITVQYPGNLSNTVNFTAPSLNGVQNRGCEDTPLDFVNTSARTTGWTYLWEYGDAGNTSFGLDGQYVYNNPGVYTVQLTQDSVGCKFKSAAKQIQVVNCPSVGEESIFANNVKMIPNPTNGIVTFNIDNVDDNVKVEVYNIIGAVVKTISDNNVNGTYTRTVDLSNLASGTYMVKFQSGSKVAVKKLNISK